MIDWQVIEDGTITDHRFVVPTNEAPVGIKKTMARGALVIDVITRPVHSPCEPDHDDRVVRLDCDDGTWRLEPDRQWVCAGEDFPLAVNGEPLEGETILEADDRVVIGSAEYEIGFLPHPDQDDG